MIQAQALCKRYGSTVALDRLSLSVPAGSIFGLLGPNGAGKSTFVKLLLELIMPDGGSLAVHGVARQQIGYLPERPSMPPRSRVAEYLTLMGRLSGLRGRRLRSAVEQRLVQVGMRRAAETHIGACSKGMLQRLGLAVALIGDPPLVVLDEPMEGLDPAWQKTVRELFAELHRQGKTVLLSTHRLSDVAQVCSHVAILSQGRLKVTGALDEVLPPRQQVLIGVDHLPDELRAALSRLHPDIRVGGAAIVLNGETLPLKSQVLQMLLSADVDIVDITRQRLSLEEVYLEAVRS